MQIGFKNISQIRDIYQNDLIIGISEPFYLNEYRPLSSSTEQNLVMLGEVASSASQMTLITNLLVQTLLGKALGSIWVAMNTFQIIYYLPLINFQFPSVLIRSLQFLEFSNVDDNWIGQPFFYEFLDLDSVKDKPLNDRFEEYGQESTIFFISYA